MLYLNLSLSFLTYKTGIIKHYKVVIKKKKKDQIHVNPLLTVPDIRQALKYLLTGMEGEMRLKMVLKGLILRN